MIDVVGYEGLYKVDEQGAIWSIRRQRYLTHSICKDGVRKVTLTKDGKQRNVLVHRIVAIAFIRNEENKPQVDHVDGDKSNNTVNNLRWCTNIENQEFRHTQGNSGKEGTGKAIQWGDTTFSSITAAARYIASIRGSKVDTVKKELKAARYGAKILYGKITTILL